MRGIFWVGKNNSIEIRETLITTEHNSNYKVTEMCTDDNANMTCQTVPQQP